MMFVSGFLPISFPLESQKCRDISFGRGSSVDPYQSCTIDLLPLFTQDGHSRRETTFFSFDL